VRESLNSLQLTIDLTTELERVQVLAKFPERGELTGDGSLIYVLSLQPIQRRAWKIVGAAQLRADSHSLDQLRRRLKEIQAQAQLVAIQAIHAFPACGVSQRSQAISLRTCVQFFCSM